MANLIGLGIVAVGEVVGRVEEPGELIFIEGYNTSRLTPLISFTHLEGDKFIKEHIGDYNQHDIVIFSEHSSGRGIILAFWSNGILGFLWSR